MLLCQTEEGVRACRVFDHRTMMQSDRISLLAAALQDFGCDTIAGFSLRGFDMSDNDIRQILAILKSANVKFDRLRFPNNNMKKVGGDELSAAEMVDLSQNTIDTIDIADVDEVSCNSLHLRHNRLECHHFVSLAELLEGNETLRFLDLSYNRINFHNSEGPIDFTTNSIRTLYLAANHMPRVEGPRLLGSTNAIVDILKSTSLTCLDINSCRLDRQMMTEILEAASTNTTLTSLDVGHNDITDESLIHLIRNNDTLKSLSAYKTALYLDHPGIADALSVNTTLTSIHINTGASVLLYRATESTQTRNSSLYELLIANLQEYMSTISFKRQRE